MNNKQNNKQNNKPVVNVIWTDPLTQITYQADVNFDVKLDFDKMNNIILSF